MLQVFIFETSQTHVESMDSSDLLIDVMVIADEVGSQLAQATTSYITEAGSDDQAIEA